MSWTWVAGVTIFLLAAPIEVPECRAAETVGPLVEEIVAAYGGGEAIRKLEAFRIEGRVSALRREKAGSMRRDFAAPDKLLVEISYPDGVERRLLSGGRGFRGTGAVLAEVQGPPKQAMVYQMIRSAIPLVLVRNEERLVHEGMVRRDGRDFVGLSLAPSGELRVLFLVNRETGRVERVEGEILAGGRKIPFATDYRDFRVVEDLLFPFAEENFAGGVHTGTTTVEKVLLSPEDLGPFLAP